MQAGHLSSALTVALLVSAWIETSVIPTVGAKLPSSHSSWVRGLKLTLYMLALSQNRRTPRECVDWNNFRFDETTSSTVALLVSAWIETSFGLTKSQTTLSHSSWVRGLKHARLPFQSGSSVALLVSAWIETINSVLIWPPLMSRTPRECVDWNYITLLTIIRKKVALLVSAWIETYHNSRQNNISCRTPRECVDWNKVWTYKAIWWNCRTPRECVDWNK